MTTVRFIETYLKPGARILEIGAGTGRYSHYFAQKGYAVDAVELVPLHVEQFKQATRSGENVTVVQGDARDLAAFGDEQYDITLLLGPLYHLTDEADRKQVLSEALRVTKHGGVVFAAYILNEMTVMNYLFRKNRIADQEIAERAEEQAFRLDEIPEKGLAICRVEDIDALMSGFSVKRLHLVGTDMFSGMIRGLLSDMDDAAFEHYVNYIQTICERSDMIGLSGHLLDVFRKK
ncbi:MAG: class I SAM-dependent methyltransferase [Clostridia bacterium]|nr:class I SAM-dependent methyltransferase [Clostridia bacterium]